MVRHLPSPVDDVCWFAYPMGWRREQVLSLRWADINRDAGTVIRRTEFNKAKEPSVLATSESVRAVIERRWSARFVTWCSIARASRLQTFAARGPRRASPPASS